VEGIRKFIKIQTYSIRPEFIIICVITKMYGRELLLLVTVAELSAFGVYMSVEKPGR
jgi:hypothetical protein